MLGSTSLRMYISPPWNHRRQPPQHICASLTKQGHRFLSSLAVNRDSKTADRLISKFVASSPQFISLNALSHLLSPNTNHPHLSSLAFPLYSRITKESWFQWNPKLVAELIALLDKQGQFEEETETLIFETVSKLESKERELVQFYGNLIDSYSKHDSKRGFDDVYARLNRLVSSSSSVYVKRQAFKSMVSGLCEMGKPHEAENLITEIKVQGIKPSSFEFRSIIYGYGRLGFFEDMERIVNQMESAGSKVDTVCSNMVLSSYGAHDAISRMVSWLKKMKDWKIPFSIRTYNSVLNSCSTIMSMLQDSSNDFSLSIEDLIGVLNEDEGLVVKELVESSVLDEAMKWDATEGKLDLHGMHLSSAYLIMLQWMEETRYRFSNGGKYVIPAEITVVCGSGKHSNVRGESPVKAMVKKMAIQTNSPLRIDRNNIGCFIAKGHVVKNWLC